jgi:hypothetical protein
MWWQFHLLNLFLFLLWTDEICLHNRKFPVIKHKKFYHQILLWASSIQFTSSQKMCVRSMLVLYLHVCVDVTDLCLWSFPIKVLHVYHLLDGICYQYLTGLVFLCVCDRFLLILILDFPKISVCGLILYTITVWNPAISTRHLSLDFTPC